MTMTSKGTESTIISPSILLHHDLLVSAKINILNNRTQPIRGRALLDTGSSMNFITEKFANSLGKTGEMFSSNRSPHTLPHHSHNYLHIWHIYAYIDVFNHTDNIDIGPRSTSRSLNNLNNKESPTSRSKIP